MTKTFVLDTNVLLHEPRAPFRFGDNDVALPIFVLEEIDQFKRDLSELGRNAREFSRSMDRLRAQGSLSDGIRLESGGTLRVIFMGGRSRPPAEVHSRTKYDDLILGSALELQAQNDQQRVVFVTKDTNLRVRADVHGLDSVDYDPEREEITDLYPGHREIYVSEEQLRSAFDGSLTLDEPKLCANEFVLLRNLSQDNHTALARFDGSNHCIRALVQRRDPVWGITPRNKEQQYAVDLLLDDAVKLVTLVGKAGTGKTLLAIAAGLYKVTEDDTFKRVLVSRPIFPLGRDMGYLPGTVEEKLDPWMKPIYDNVELLMSLSQTGRKDGPDHRELVDLGIMEIEPLTYIRGRSIPRQFLIVDEAQNLTPHEVKTILTRAGEGTKVVLTGDPHQIDNPYVDTTNNGLVHLVRRFQNEPIAGTVTLSRGERSDLAELAANLL